MYFLWGYSGTTKVSDWVFPNHFDSCTIEPKKSDTQVSDTYISNTFFIVFPVTRAKSDTLGVSLTQWVSDIKFVFIRVRIKSFRTILWTDCFHCKLWHFGNGT